MNLPPLRLSSTPQSNVSVIFINSMSMWIIECLQLLSCSLWNNNPKLCRFWKKKIITCNDCLIYLPWQYNPLLYSRATQNKRPYARLVWEQVGEICEQGTHTLNSLGLLPPRQGQPIFQCSAPVCEGWLSIRNDFWFACDVALSNSKLSNSFPG